MSYPSMPEARSGAYCQAQEFDGEEYHACEFVSLTAHAEHRCACGHGWGAERAWLHGRKGKIVGEVVRVEGEWMWVRLAVDAWADVRRRHLDLAGSVVQYRRSLMVEVVHPMPESDDAGTASGRCYNGEPHGHVLTPASYCYCACHSERGS
jgi:hypothetical protein